MISCWGGSGIVSFGNMGRRLIKSSLAHLGCVPLRQRWLCWHDVDWFILPPYVHCVKLNLNWARQISGNTRRICLTTNSNWSMIMCLKFYFQVWVCVLCSVSSATFGPTLLFVHHDRPDVPPINQSVGWFIQHMERAAHQQLMCDRCERRGDGGRTFMVKVNMSKK